MGEKKRKIAIASEEDVAKYAPGNESVDTERPEAAGGEGAPEAEKKQAAEPKPKTPEEQIEEYKDKWLRAQAECANISKRLRQEYAESLKLAGMGLARSLLPVVDSFDRTLGTLDQSSADDPVVKGIHLISDQLHKTLRDHGIVPIEAVGQPFDPRLHEAMMQDRNSDAPANTITMELERGYMMHDRVLRPSKVAVVVGSEPEAVLEDEDKEDDEENQAEV